MRLGEGNDRITGNIANNKLYGRDGNDSVYGRDGNDTLRGEGGNGDDYIYGVEGNDLISGEDGDDFLMGGENDVIFDFSESDNDIIDLSYIIDIVDYADLDAGHTSESTDGWLSISYTDTTVLVIGLDYDDINAAHFNFEAL